MMKTMWPEVPALMDGLGHTPTETASFRCLHAFRLVSRETGSLLSRAFLCFVCVLCYRFNSLTGLTVDFGRGILWLILAGFNPMVSAASYVANNKPCFFDEMLSWTLARKLFGGAEETVQRCWWHCAEVLRKTEQRLWGNFSHVFNKFLTTGE